MFPLFWDWLIIVLGGGAVTSWNVDHVFSTASPRTSNSAPPVPHTGCPARRRTPFSSTRCCGWSGRGWPPNSRWALPSPPVLCGNFHSALLVVFFFSSEMLFFFYETTARKASPWFQRCEPCSGTRPLAKHGMALLSQFVKVPIPDPTPRRRNGGSGTRRYGWSASGAPSPRPGRTRSVAPSPAGSREDKGGGGRRVTPGPIFRSVRSVYPRNDADSGHISVDSKRMVLNFGNRVEVRIGAPKIGQFEGKGWGGC